MHTKILIEPHTALSAEDLQPDERVLRWPIIFPVSLSRSGIGLSTSCTKPQKKSRFAAVNGPRLPLLKYNRAECFASLTAQQAPLHHECTPTPRKTPFCQTRRYSPHRLKIVASLGEFASAPEPSANFEKKLLGHGVRHHLAKLLRCFGPGNSEKLSRARPRIR